MRSNPAHKYTSHRLASTQPLAAEPTGPSVAGNTDNTEAVDLDVDGIVAKSVLQKLPDYYKAFSRKRGNGVFLLSRRGVWRSHGDAEGPAGWDTKAYPEGGAPFEGFIGFNVVWNAGPAYITYGEASKSTEELWMKPNVHPVADRTLDGFFAKLVEAARSNLDPKVKELSLHIIKDLGLDEEFLLQLKARSKGRKLNPQDEDKLARVLNNPKRHL